jgi:repressor of nif and glnA expression
MTHPLRLVHHKIEDYAMHVTFDPVTGEGDVVYNLSLVRNEDLEYSISILKDAYRSGVSVSGLVKIFKSGEEIGNDFCIPEGCTGIGTMCSITFDGLLIRKGIPVNPIGGGIVEIENRAPIRFTHMILYRHTTIDPLQVLMSQKTTSVIQVMRRGSGNILANIREFHMEAESLVGQVLDEIASSSYSGILEVGMPNVPLLGVPVSPQYIAIVAVGGTNPMAAIRESNRWVETQAMKGLISVRDMDEIRSF